MRYLSPVASQKHLNAHMIEGMLGLHTVWLHYYPGISKPMHFTKKLVWRRREEIYIYLVQPAYGSSAMISVPVGGIQAAPGFPSPSNAALAEGWAPVCSYRSTEGACCIALGWAGQSQR